MLITEHLQELLTDPGDHWMEYALCTEVDPELFFPKKGENATAAKRICGKCEAQTECLERALELQERAGVWGGTTGAERRVILQERGVLLPPEEDPEEEEDQRPETDVAA